MSSRKHPPKGQFVNWTYIHYSTHMLTIEGTTQDSVIWMHSSNAGNNPGNPEK